MSPFDVGVTGALLAGLLSFLSPCVLPLVPPYLCFLGGVSAEQLTAQGSVTAGASRRVLLAAVAFVMGFGTVFVLMGASASAAGRLVTEYLPLLAQVAGIALVVLGLHFLGVLKVPWLYREIRYQPAVRPAGLAGAYLVGLAFAFGWTPCVGPVLAAILMLAASEESAWQGAGLLAGYALGIGIPFLAAAALARPFLLCLQRFRRHVRRVEQLMGVLLIATGVVFLSGKFNELGYWLLETFPGLGRLG